MSTVRVLVVTSGDSVGVCLEGAGAGDVVSDTEVVVRDDIPLGHKVAMREHAVGDHVIKYGESIGVATRPILPGEHVHVHNVDSARAIAEHEVAT